MKSWSFLKGQGLPVLSFLDQKQEELLSAANLYNLAFAQVKEWRRKKISAGDIVILSSLDAKSLIITTIAACIGEQTLVLESSKELPSFIKNHTTGGIWFQTSGTKKAKWVFLKWSSIMIQVEAHAKILSGSQHLTRLSILPKKHSFGLVVDLLVGLFLRQVILVTTSTLSGEICRKVTSYLEPSEGLFICSTPRLLQILLESHELKDHLCHSEVLVGGALLPIHLKTKAEEKLHRLWEGYGLTEAGPGVLVDGKPLSFVQLNLTPFATHESGVPIYKLFIQSETLGWIEGHPPTSKFYPTNDLVIKSPDGRLKIIGRNDDCVKSLAGTWSDVEQIENDIKKKFRLAHAHVLITNGQIQIGISETDSSTYQNITSYLSQKFGLNSLIKKLSPDPHLSQQKTKDIRQAFLASGIEIL